jgi:hypothetical protein
MKPPFDALQVGRNGVRREREPAGDLQRLQSVGGEQNDSMLTGRQSMDRWIWSHVRINA